jgi:glucosamine--fructose-6-phosphate aminotransferase (isomerizing)
MIEPVMVQDIRNQPASLAGVLDYQLSAGREALGRAAAQIGDASRVVVTGMGASLFAAMPFANRLAGQGTDVHIVEASELLHYRAELCRKAVVVLVSRSGESVEILKLLPILHECGAVAIGVTNEPASSLANSADTTVLVNSRNDEMVAVQTYTGTVLTLLLLAETVHGESPGRMRLDGESVVRSCADLATRLLDGDFGWRDFLEGACVVHVFGRGPSLGSVHEGALLFNETAKLPSVAATPGAFRHGPVEIVDHDFRAIVFATQDRTRELDLRFASDLSQIGARVNVVAPGGTWPIPRVPATYLSVLEIVPLQVAAVRAAEMRGVRAGHFRYVSKVTASEAGLTSYKQQL